MAQNGGKLAIPKRAQRKLTLESSGGIIAALGFILAWQIASMYAPPYAIPSWGRIIDALVKVPINDVEISLARLILSMVVSFVVGLSFSMLIFEHPVLEALLLPYVKLVMAIPAVCWVVFAILWFKGVEFRIFFVMCATCMPVFIVDSLDAMKSVPLDLRQMVRSFQPDPIQFYVKIIFPAILPNILTSWKINLTLAVRVVTVAELVGAVSGIGHGLVMAQEVFSVAEVFAWTVVLVLILFMLQGLVSIVERRTLRWRRA